MELHIHKVWLMGWYLFAILIMMSIHLIGQRDRQSLKERTAQTWTLPRKKKEREYRHLKHTSAAGYLMPASEGGGDDGEGCRSSSSKYICTLFIIVVVVVLNDLSATL